MSDLHHIQAKRIALLKPSALGDIVHALPVLSALRAKFPKAHVTWVVNRSYAALLDGHPDLSEVLSFSRRGGIWAIVKLARELYRRRFDLVIDLQGLLRTGAMAAATLATRRIGLADAREGARAIYTDTIPVDPQTHAVDRYWRIAEALGVGGCPKRFVVPMSDGAMAWADSTLTGRPRPWLMLGVGARWVTKRWPAAHFADLASRFQRRYGGTVIFVGGAEESSIVQSIIPRLAGPMIDLTGKTTLPQLAAILAVADAVLANDTGPAHLAAALGRPVVAPYTCTKVQLHGPYGQRGGVESAVACQGSYLKTCRRMDCMAELTPDRLWPALEETLSRWSVRCHSV
jgi:lipopolysaccharide heptosyltransferase I